MRVISQDRTIDVPYDYFSLSIASGKYEDVEVKYIYCHNLSSTNGTKLAKYSSIEKALKVMELLRESYLKFAHATNDNSFYTFFDNPKVFLFPADDEVKV